MDPSKYDGNIHPDEWINDIQKYHNIWKIKRKKFLNIAISLVDPIIKLPTEINDIEKLRNALKEDISFIIFKNTNKRKLQSLKYIPESRGGDTSRFISYFLKLCYNAEINDIEEQKSYLYKSLSMKHLDSISKEFHEKMNNIDSLKKLVKEFENFAVYESNLITSESIVALKHVATGKYLSSLCPLTRSFTQSVYVGGPEPSSNSLWKIKFNNRELATYTNNTIKLQHINSGVKFLGVDGSRKSSSDSFTEVNCNYSDNNNTDSYWSENWKFNHSKLGNYQGYLKSNDIINLSIEISTNNRYSSVIRNFQIEFLRSHDIQVIIGDDSFQEVVCHNDRLGENDEWCIELVEQYVPIST
ncbi:hypothetical protein GLOIN_2v1543781 [Rhizophagus clarus]|nr:hypothetical protein GLOIN_2v1543781 [Rhizophagus clarus]